MRLWHYIGPMLNPKEIFKFEVESFQEGSETIYKTKYVLDGDCPYLNGHFPNQPVLPAVATIDASVEFLRQALHRPDLQPRSIANAKFMAPIVPGLKIEVSLLPVSDSKWNADWTTLTPTGEIQLLARVSLQL